MRHCRPTFVALSLVVLLLGGCSLFHRKPGPRPAYKKLRPPVAYEMMRDSPQMTVIDLRAAQQYDGPTGHIRDARSIPLATLPYKLLELSPLRDETLFIYCDSDACTEQGAKLLAASGFDSIVGMAGGIDKWIRDGYKTVLPARLAKRLGEVGDKPVMPERPGEKRNDPNREVTVTPPVPPPAPPDAPPPPPPRVVAAPRQIR